MSAGKLLVGVMAFCVSVSGCDSEVANNKSQAVAHSGLRSSHPGGRTLGFVLANVDELTYQTKDEKAQCPDGLLYSNLQQWEAQFPTPGARRAQLTHCGGDYQRRGPHC